MTEAINRVLGTGPYSTKDADAILAAASDELAAVRAADPQTDHRSRLLAAALILMSSRLADMYEERNHDT